MRSLECAHHGREDAEGVGVHRCFGSGGTAIRLV